MNNAESLTVRLIIGHCNDGHSSQLTPEMYERLLTLKTE